MIDRAVGAPSLSAPAAPVPSQNRDGCIGAQAWTQFKIPADVAKAAGLQINARTKAAGARTRAASLDLYKVLKAIPASGSTKKALMDRLGATVGQVSGALKKLEEAGQVGSHTDPKHSGRGKAALIYTKA